jgi:hypothetical protein
LDALEGTQWENVQQQNQESTVAHLALVYLNMLYSPMISCCWESRAWAMQLRLLLAGRVHWVPLVLSSRAYNMLFPSW